MIPEKLGIIADVIFKRSLFEGNWETAVKEAAKIISALSQKGYKIQKVVNND